MKRAVDITILNQSYTIKTPLSDEEINNIVGMLNKELEKVEKHGGTFTTSKLAILAALQITAEKYFTAKRIDTLINQISEVF